MTNKVNITTDAGADAAMINEAVAARIKRYRAEKKISLMSCPDARASAKVCW